ncbi:polysaccharide deacetylase family protein [Clostridium uliginosum]|uniref:Peptidoglycan/xylan/chitin deacetylase, PgdA/CDA1 family n=1 Tax=Clostridium uliginosum TaxID=119641 RepID=A0A1I1HYS1_9CLOT|nr:polysaccharide deacetylase family protein [Clostridium uliginosum]SFC29036.1 Peptidoglycan/xylan/chitin deacetylase, PgdA/CDA1 family [Clostridium uliginosum]
MKRQSNVLGSTSTKEDYKNSSDKLINQNSTNKLSNVPIYLPILGESKNLTKKEKENMKRWRNGIIELAKKNKTSVYINGSTEKKQIALTFDDGPDGIVTPKILDVLKAENVRASFFFIGKNVILYPEVVKRAYNEGNLILNHSLTHVDLSNKKAEVIDSEIESTGDRIFSLINKRPAIIRPPYGALSQNSIDEIVKNNYKIVIWSIDTLDWSQKESSNITKNVLDNARDGDIVLMHSDGDKKATLEALPVIIEGLKKKGYKIVTLDELLNIKAYQ